MGAIGKKLKENKRFVYTVCALVFAVGLLLCGLSLAYFTSRDAVTNVHKASGCEITLFENEWNDHGAEQASVMQPGMVIDKDPAVSNIGENAVYLRMKITFKDKSGNEIKYTSDRGQALISSLYTGTGDSAVQLMPYAATLVSQNENYVYNADDGWFYYGKYVPVTTTTTTTDSETGEETEVEITTQEFQYTQLSVGATAPTLFDEFKIPIYTANNTATYGYGYSAKSNFSQAYTIEVTAQAILASTPTDMIDSAFSRNYTEATTS
jgi:hypothetical protein